jgi:hypothetical protein
MVEWLMQHAIDAVVKLLTKTLLKPILWSGQSIRLAREKRKMMDDNLNEALRDHPADKPSSAFLQSRRTLTMTLWAHVASWILLFGVFALLYPRIGTGVIEASILILIVVAYFNVDVRRGSKTRFPMMM